VTSPAATLALARMARGVFASAAWLPGHDLVQGPVHYHAFVSLRFGCGLAMALLTLPALTLALLRGGGERYVALAILGYWATLAASPLVLARFFLPTVPGLCVLISGLVVRSAFRLSMSQAVRAAALTAMALLVMVEPATSSVSLVRLLGRPDTRALAAEWISANTPPGAHVVTWGAPTTWTDYGAPSLPNRRVSVRLASSRWQASGVDVVIHHTYPLPYSGGDLPSGDARPALDRVAVFDPFDGPLANPVFEPLDAFYLPLARFSGIARPGPRIEIYTLRR